MDLKNRKGSVKIRKKLIDDALKDVNKLLEHFFKDFFPVNMEYCHFDDNFIYYGYSSQFKEIQEGEEIPEYNAMITIDESLGFELYTVKFKEIV